jgi:hypothetical protein
MTQCVVGTPTFRAKLVALLDETELNAVIIDLKDYTGKLAFTTDTPSLAPSVSDQCGARDMRSFVEMLHGKGIYVIGRITVFQDPYYSSAHPDLAVKFASPAGAVWKDHKGLSFIDVGAKPYWDYIITVSREAHALGFDELNYDYIRYPSDGPMSNIHFDWAQDKPKAVALEEFYAYLSKAMKDPTVYPPGVQLPAISADLFGMVTTNYDDLNIGQVLERALPYFDYVCPMVYPSHYPKGFNGWANPNTVVYDLLHFVLASAVRRTVADSSPVQTFDAKPMFETVVVPPTSSTTATTTKEVATVSRRSYDKDKIRPWIQDFDYGGDYGPTGCAQIQAPTTSGSTRGCSGAEQHHTRMLNNYGTTTKQFGSEYRCCGMGEYAYATPVCVRRRNAACGCRRLLVVSGNDELFVRCLWAPHCMVHSRVRTCARTVWGGGQYGVAVSGLMWQ